MMDPSSRYALVGTTTFTDSQGETIAYLRRRLLPQGTDLPVLIEVTVTQGDRLDQIANRTLGNPLEFWRVADANNALNPFDLVAEPGRKLRVPIPQTTLPIT